MTPQQHYNLAEDYAQRAENAGGNVPEAGNKFALLSIAHALMAIAPVSGEVTTSPTTVVTLPSL